ncbi:MAG: transporter, partial [Proteiniphilum sp.]
MKTIITTLLVLFAGTNLNAQTNINSLLTSIEENNTTLQSLRESAEAHKLENKTGIYLENPEVGFDYLWGNPSDIGKRTDFSV